VAFRPDRGIWASAASKGKEKPATRGARN
jgi:hypothetical protein